MTDSYAHCEGGAEYDPGALGSMNYDDDGDRIDSLELMRQESEVIHLYLELLKKGAYMGMTMAPTVFGDFTTLPDGDRIPNYRQTVVLETPEARIYSVGDGKMTLNEHGLWLAEMARLRGWL